MIDRLQSLLSYFKNINLKFSDIVLAQKAVTQKTFNSQFVDYPSKIHSKPLGFVVPKSEYFGIFI